MQHTESPLGRELTILGKKYLTRLRTKLKHLDIDRYYYALVLIERHAGSINQQQLALLLDSDKVSVVRIIDYLSAKGYVERIKKEGDRRKYNLIITDKARLALPEIKQSFSEINKIALCGLSIAQITQLTDTLEIIKNNITHNS